MRSAKVTRKTKETDISLELNLDGTGKSQLDTGCGFLDHMLCLLAKHSKIDLNVKCSGDTEVDFHHSVEDIGIALGQAFCKAIGEKVGICRYGQCFLPMDEACICSAIDISGRPFLVYDLELPTEKVGDYDTELDKEFWLGFINNAKLALHVYQMSGDNSHHIIEAEFKSVARSLRTAISVDPDYSDEVPSTKGVL